MKTSTGIIFLFVGIFYATQTFAAPRMMSIPHAQVLELMQSEPSFKEPRHPIRGINARSNMRKFINDKFGRIAGTLGGIEKGHITNETTYETRTFYYSGNQRQEQTITGTNLYLILKGSNELKDDEPIIILANYDSDDTGNTVEDNGSGIAALLVVGDYFTKQLADEKIKLEHSVVLIASDTSVRKYQANLEGVPSNGSSGADIVANQFIPDFMKDRKSLRGVIVLDSLLNYNNNSNTQQGHGIDKAYPVAYGLIAKSEHAGNFLAMVSRDSNLDKDLVSNIEFGWNRALRQPKLEQGGNNPDPAQNQIDPPIINFIKKLSDPDTDAVQHFARSEQNSIWNHHSRTGVPQYPAVLLTDTREYRDAICKSPNCNYLEASTDPKNLAFIHRTIMTVHYVLRQQSDKALEKGAAPSIQSTSILMLTSLIALSFRYTLALYI